LNSQVWPNPEHSLDERIARTVGHANVGDDNPAGSRYVWHFICEGDAVVSMARTFRRIVANEQVGPFAVLALASVSTDPAYRLKGLAKAVVKAAFSRLDGELKVCFFQTGVPAFYQGIGAKLIHNPIVDSTGAKRTFWEPHAMIYPSHGTWPDGPIDLLGEGW
jgi:predicted GNAT family acetyltransferase